MELTHAYKKTILTTHILKGIFGVFLVSHDIFTLILSCGFLEEDLQKIKI